MTSVTHALRTVGEPPAAAAPSLEARALQAAATRAELVDRSAAALTAHAARVCDVPLGATTATGVR